MGWEIRPIKAKDTAAVIGLLRSNTPYFFDPSEEKDFVAYLEKEIEDYFVVDLNGEIIGAGGINYFPEERIARISWDIIHPNSQGKGIGKSLLEYRIKHLKQNTKVDSIVVRTSQLAYRFYEKAGFDLKKVEKDYWTKNYDLYLMEMKNVHS